MVDVPHDDTRAILAAFMKENGLAARKVAMAIGCSEATIKRILEGTTRPTDEMVTQIALMIDAGFKRYAAMTSAEKEHWTEKVSAGVGGALGLSWISAAVSAAGSVSGLSAAGITSGLAALGFGGGMIVGVGVVAAIPIGVGAAGYGVARLAKRGMTEWNLSVKDLDERWESLGDGATL